MKIKICGMGKNISEIAGLGPDFLGFIFWQDSSRFMTGHIPELPKDIKRVGVFVDQDLEEVIRHCWEYKLDFVQLHGNESPEYCAQLVAITVPHPRQLDGRRHTPGIIKAFNISAGFNFADIQAYEPYCDYYLFDAKGKLPGGNSLLFDWSLLQGYKGKVPFFLSGGIGPDEIPSIIKFMSGKNSEMCKVIDVNSKFEIAPAEKDREMLSGFLTELRKAFPKKLNHE